MTTFVDDFEKAKGKLESVSLGAKVINGQFKTTPACTFLLRPPLQSQTVVSAKTASSAIFKLDKRGRHFEAQTPAYVHHIRFKGQNLTNLLVSLVGADGKPKTLSVTPYTAFAQCSVRDFCTGFDLVPKGNSNKPILTSVEIFGFPGDDLEVIKSCFTSFHSSMLSLKEALVEAEVKVTSSQQELSENKEAVELLKQNAVSAEDELAGLTSQLVESKKEIIQLDVKRKVLSDKVEALTRDELSKENNCQQLASQAESLNQEIAEVSKELAGLVNDRSLISDEFQDYVREGKQQSAVYIKLMIVPCFVIGLCAALLYNGAHDLLYGHYVTSEDKLAALLLRIPFATVLGAIAYYSWSIANKFLGKIFEVESERLTLAKLLVIAKDTVFSTADEVGVERSEKFYLRTRLKVEMLKAYLSNNLGGSFNFLSPGPRNPNVKNSEGETLPDDDSPIAQEETGKQR